MQNVGDYPNDARILADPEWGIVISNSKQGLWFRKSGEIHVPVLSEKDFDSFYRAIRVVSNGNGLLYLVGKDRFDPQLVTIGRISYGDKILQRADTSVTNRLVANGIINSSRINVFGSEVVAIGQAYSTNAGETWYYRPDPINAGQLSNIAYNKQDGFLGYSAVEEKWYKLDLLSGSWSEYTPDKPFEVLKFTDDGVAVGIEFKFGLPYNLYYKVSSDDEWLLIDSIQRIDGKIIPLRSVFGIGGIFSDYDSTIVVAVDSGVVVLITKNGVKSFSLPQQAFAQVSGRNSLNFSRYGSLIALNYENDIYTIDVETNVSEILPYRSGLSSSVLCVFEGSVFAFAEGTSGLLWRYSPQENLWYADMKLTDFESKKSNTVSLLNMVNLNDAITGITSDGQVVKFNSLSKKLVLEQPRMLINPYNMNYRKYLIGARRISATPNGYYILGDNPRLSDGDSVKFIGLDTASFITESPNGRQYSGYNQLFVRADSSTAWQNIGFPDDTSKDYGPISSVWSDDNMIVVCVRGYARTNQGDTLGVIQGGIFYSTDGGVTFSNSSISVGGLWAENIFRTEDGSLLAWISDMELMGDTARLSRLDFLENDANLIRSTDKGITWQQVFSLTVGNRTSEFNAWRIAQSGNDLFALAPRNFLLHSVDNGQNWNSINLEIESSVVNDLFVMSNGDIVLITNDGIRFINISTDIQDSNPQFFPVFGLTTTPNPITNHVTVRVRNRSLYPRALSVCQIVDLLGNTMINLLDQINRSDMGSDSDIDIDTSNWHSGVYALVYAADGQLKSAKILKTP